MAGPLRPNPPPPSSLMANEILERWKKGLKKNVIFNILNIHTCETFLVGNIFYAFRYFWPHLAADRCILLNESKSNAISK